MIKHARNLDVMKKRHHVWPWIVFPLLIMVLIGIAGYGAYSFYTQAMQVKNHEERAMSLLNGASGKNKLDEIQSISTALPDIQRETAAADDISHSRLWDLATKLPKYGDDIVTVRGMTKTVNDMVHGTVPQFVGVVTDLKNAKLNEGDGQLNLEPIIVAQQNMTRANDVFQTQVKSFNALPQPKIEQVSDAYGKARKQLDAMSKKVDDATNMLQVLPTFLGTDHPRTYVLAAMTTSEARSSGGLIGSMGVITADKGKISIGDFKANSAYVEYGNSNPTSDETRVFNAWGPLAMSFDIRDSAAYPDTSRTADGIRTILQRTPWGKDINPDAVILIDPVFLQELNQVNGNVTLTDGRVLTGQNTAEFLLNTVYQDYPVAYQDAYFQEVAARSVASMFSNMKIDKLTTVAKLMPDLAKERHFAMYSFDSQLQKVVSQLKFTAHTPNSAKNPSVGVYLNEQSPSKMDWYVKRTANVLRQSCNADGSQTYHVDYALNNTITNEQAFGLPKYVTGVSTVEPGMAIEKIMVYPPKDGSISNLRITGANQYEIRQESMNGTIIEVALVYISPGSTATLSFDTNTSHVAKGDLAVDQTPMGWRGSGVTLNTKACKVQ